MNRLNDKLRTTEKKTLFNRLNQQNHLDCEFHRHCRSFDGNEIHKKKSTDRRSELTGTTMKNLRQTLVFGNRKR